MSQTVSRPTKLCPYCGEKILAVAVKCRYCQELLDEDAPVARRRRSSSSTADRIIMPVDRTLLSILAGYLGLLAPIPFVHVAALGLGIVAILDLSKKPRMCGRGRAWFGAIMGGLFTVLYILLLLISRV